MSAPHIAIIGAGPIGLEAAARAIIDGYRVSVFEKGSIAANVQSWGHVVLFSPFGMNRSTWGLGIVRKHTTTTSVPDDDELLTGHAFAERYLIPLGEAMAQHADIHAETRVVAIGRTDLLKHEAIGDHRRGSAGFRILTECTDGQQQSHAADILIDASGTYGHHRPLGTGGIPAIGEQAAADRIHYLLDDPTGSHRERYANRRVLLVGSGYSAATSIIALDELRRTAADTSITWLVRNNPRAPITVIDHDRLPQRAAIATRANDLANSDHVRMLQGTIDRIDRNPDDCLRVSMTHPTEAPTSISVDRILANVGYTPDNTIYRELQVHECYATLGPMKLAASLMGNASTDCLDQTAPGPDVLTNPEPNFFILGSKSYGRNSAFLIRVGIEQIDQLFAHILTPTR